MIWYLWTNTETVLDACARNDTFYMATPGGLLVFNNNSIVKKYTTLDGLMSAEVLSVDCNNGVWVLTSRGLQYLTGSGFSTVELIAFNDPQEVLEGKRIRSFGNFMFILGKSRIISYRISDSTEIPFPVSFSKPLFLDIYTDTLLVGDTSGFYKVKYDDFNLNLWDTVFVGRPVFSAVKHITYGWIMGTDTGIVDTLGNILWLGGKTIRFLALRGDTIWAATMSSVYKILPPFTSPTKVMDGYALYLSKDFVGFGVSNAPFYMFGKGIYFLPDMSKLKTGGLSFTTLTGMINLGDSIIVCGRSAPGCAVWPSGETFGFGSTNFVRYYKGKIYMGLNGGGLVILNEDFSDTVFIMPPQLGGFGYLFDMAVLRDNVYFVGWEPSGNSRVFKLKDTLPEETGITDYAISLLYSTGDKLILCGQSICKIYYEDLSVYGSINVQANVVYSFGDTVIFGTNDGVELYSLKTLGFIRKSLQGHIITGVWVDLLGRIWVSGDMGLYLLGKDLLPQRTFTPYNSPLPGVSKSSTELYPLRFTLVADPVLGKMYVSTDKGIAIIKDTVISSGWWVKLKVYPNPAGRNDVVIIGNCPYGARLRVFTSSGVYMKSVDGCSFKNDLPAGLYIISVEYMGRRSVIKAVMTDR